MWQSPAVACTATRADTLNARPGALLGTELGSMQTVAKHSIEGRACRAHASGLQHDLQEGVNL